MAKKDGSRRLACTAHHEAGHAVASLYLRKPLRTASIIAKEDSLGRVTYHKPPAWFEAELEFLVFQGDNRVENWIRREIIISFAGSAAEARFRGRSNHRGAASDYQKVGDLALRVCASQEEGRKYLAWLWVVARTIVHKPINWNAIQLVAEELLKKRLLSGRRIRKIIQSAAMDQARKKTANIRIEAARLSDEV